MTGPGFNPDGPQHGPEVSLLGERLLIERTGD
jgi:hypothetical protein